MSFKSEIKELDGLLREVAVVVEADKVNDSMEKKFLELKKTAHLKGFRKGKAPMNIIKSNYTDQVQGDVIDELIKETYGKIIEEHKLPVASYPTLTEANLTDDGAFNYKVNVEVFPEIDKIDSEGLEITEFSSEATDDEVNEQIDVILRQQSELKPVDHAATENDTVTVDLKKIFDPNMVLPDSDFPDSVVDLGNKMTLKEFQDCIPGMKVGEEKEIEVNYPKNYSDPKFAGATLKYSAKLKSVSERITPELDDAFVKKTGIAETALELKLKVREDITNFKEEQANKGIKNVLIGQMCEKNQILVPVASVKEYLDGVVEDMKKQEQEFDEESVRNQYRPMGENSFRWGMVYHRLAELEKIEVLPEDTENLIKKFADNYKISVEEAQKALQSSGRIGNIRESILEEKVLDFLKSKAKVVKAKTDKK